MKRLVCQAAGSHYALYNTFRFVCTCETVPSVLLSSAFATASADDSGGDTLEVCKHVWMHMDICLCVHMCVRVWVSVGE